MTASIGLGETPRRTSHQTEPLPADPTGQRLCEIFGHYRWNFIHAFLPEDSTAKPAWTTVKNHPLRPRVLWERWQDANQLIGVRFTHDTCYALLDLDAGGAYCTAEGVAQIRAALETIGITRTLLIRSSWRGGLHVYIPLAAWVKTFDLAVALKECLKAQGFQIKAGRLEIFPNVKAYGVKTFIEYNAHRLPLQPGSGSCLLDDALNDLPCNLARFFWLWDGAASQQDMDTLRHAMKIGRDNHRKRPKRRSHPVDTWRHDLDLEITEGWTAYGQTNRLLKTIACYGRVFEGLEGQALIDYTQRIAIHCPGYAQYCRHQHEIERKVTAWARAVEGYYWPLGTPPSRDSNSCPPQNNLVPFNQQQSESAQHRIRAAYAQLEAAGELPDQITARAKAIAQAGGIALRTLYKNLSLWHPQHQTLPEQNLEKVKILDTVSNTAILVTAEAPEPEPLKSSYINKFPSSKRSMKSKEPQAEPGSDPNSFTPERGVRGDGPSFPQVSEGEAYDPELHGQIQHQIRRLRWSVESIRQFISDQFEGKRWFELTGDERVLLLYRLRVLDALGGEDLAT
jgi:hypothetical protein